MVKTFRLRLTLWYLGCFALLFSALTAGLYGVLSRAMVSRLDESLVSQAATAAALFQDEMEESHGDVAASAHEAVTNMRLQVSKVAILAGAKPVASSGPFDAAGIARHAGAASASSFKVANTRAAISRMRVNGEAFAAIAAEPLDGVEADLAAVRGAMFLALPLILALAGAGGY